MGKSYLKYLVIVLVLGFVSFMLLKIYKKIQFKKEIAAKVKTIAKLSLINTKGSKYELANEIDQKQVLLFFNTTCEHCQAEATEIQKKVTDFGSSKLIFISAEPIQEIKSFSEKYKLANHSNIIFGHLEMKQINENFGVNGFPTVFIYKAGELQKEYKGEVKIEAILKYLGE